tara:strand:- start:9638 stop:10393 length:756 start_codon:yes stop_codon:yes gene_type:complete
MLKVSIITVCYNCNNTIENTLKSVFKQKYENIEYIVIDGLSNDGTIEIINKYKSKIDKIVSEKDTGIYNAINKGIKLASGDIISLLHSDDVYTSDKIINEVVFQFNKKPTLDLLIADTAYKNNINDTKIIRYYPSSNFFPWMLRIGYSPPHVSSFFSSKGQKLVGLYNEDYKIAGDFEYFVRCFLKINLTYKKINSCYIYMTSGGKSGKNLKSYIISSLEINNALKKNNFYSNIFLTLIRIPFKLLQIKFK